MIGTTAAFVEHLSQGLAEGRAFMAMSEAVVGANAPLAIGDSFTPTHGMNEAAEDAHEHGIAITVVGRMKPTGTPWDRAIVVPVEYNWVVHGLPNGHAEGETRIGPPFETSRLPGVPAVVVRPESVAAAYGLRNVYRTPTSMAFFPAEVLVELYSVMSDVRRIMSVMAMATQALVVAAIIAGIVALIELYRQRFALLRVLGASRGFVFLSVWVFVTMIVAVGAALGLALGYGVAAVISSYLSRETGITIAARIGVGETLAVLALLGVGAVLALAGRARLSPAGSRGAPAGIAVSRSSGYGSRPAPGSACPRRRTG